MVFVPLGASPAAEKFSMRSSSDGKITTPLGATRKCSVRLSIVSGSPSTVTFTKVTVPEMMPILPVKPFWRT